MASQRVWSKLANCAILGVIGALKLALASKLPRQGVNWRVDYFPLIFPLFAFLFHFFFTFSLILSFSTPSKKRDFPSYGVFCSKILKYSKTNSLNLIYIKSAGDREMKIVALN